MLSITVISNKGIAILNKLPQMTLPSFVCNSFAALSSYGECLRLIFTTPFDS